jgi:hypothetical protein
MENYHDRIEVSLFYQRIIEILSGPPVAKAGKGKEVTGREKRSLASGRISVETMDALLYGITSRGIRLSRNKEIFSEKDAEDAASHIFRKVAKRGFK